MQFVPGVILNHLQALSHLMLVTALRFSVNAILILKMRALWLRKVDQLAQSQTAIMQWHQDSNPICRTTVAVL